MSNTMTSDTVYKSEEGKDLVRGFMNRVVENWPVKYTRFTATAAGYATEIIASGPEGAPPVILLHGTGSNMASWMGDIPTLSRRFRVFAVDIPGEPGLSDARRIPPAGNGPADWLKELLTELELKSAHFVGMSLGGLYSLLFGKTYPEMVLSMTLTAPSGLAAPRGSFIFRALPLMFLGDFGLRRISRLVSPGVELPEEMFEFSRLTSRHYKPLMAQLPVLTDGEIAGLEMPILYYGGTKDALVNTRLSADRLENRAPDARVNRLEGAGHTILGMTDEIAAFIENCTRIQAGGLHRNKGRK